jgi:hypothetical protein
MNKGYIVVEGHGEIEAARTLIDKLWRDLRLPPIFWEIPKRAPHSVLKTRAGVERMCELLRSRKDCNAALLLRDADDDDDCPAKNGPATASWIASLHLPFPTAVVLARREYEAWFLPSLAKMAGKRVPSGATLQRTVYDGDFEERRGVKEWLSKNLFPKNMRYKETLDQVALTQMVDFALLRSANLRSFGTLERALKFLATANASNVYPPPVLPAQPASTIVKARRK